MSTIYSHADKVLKLLYEFAQTQFQTVAMTAQWDNLNVLRTVSALYERIDAQARQEYVRLAQKAYNDAKNEILAVLPEKKEDFKLIGGAFVVALLKRTDRKTEYRYDREWERKRDRLTESLMAVMDSKQALVNTNDIRQALARGLNLINRQMREMADTITDEARDEAFADAGIERVMWNSQHDGRVCAVCAERDGQVYPIFQIPTKHRRCRCYMTAVIS